MTWLHYRIEGLDCPNEVKLLKRELIPLVEDEERLHFDLLQGKLSVEVACESEDRPVRKAIERTGLRIAPWEQLAVPECACCGGGEAAAKPDNLWRRRGRDLLTALSGDD